MSDLKPDISAACADLAPRTPTKLTVSRDTRASGHSIACDWNRRLPPPRKSCLSREPLLDWRSLVRRQLLSVHVPWKILSPHSTTTMTDTSVAAVNTLSKEATLILLSASQPRQRCSRFVDSAAIARSPSSQCRWRLWFAGHISP